jgi:hypothetical protein
MMKLAGYVSHHPITQEQQRELIQLYCENSEHQLVSITDQFTDALKADADAIAVCQRDMLPNAQVLELAEMLKRANKQVFCVRSEELIDPAHPMHLFG